MPRVVSGSTHGLPDADRFLDTLGGLQASPVPEARTLLTPGEEIVVARAPGRLDVMGGIADYSGSLVLQLPIREATFAAVQLDPERRLRIVSLPSGPPQRAAAWEMPLHCFESGGGGLPYEDAQALFRRDPATRWAAYAAGVWLVLMRERGAAFAQGARVLIASDVPDGKGVSSSAALEVAVMTATAAAFGLALDPRELAILCQKVEDPRWHGYLANLELSEFERYARRLPDRMGGGQFLARYGGTTDPVTRVEPGREYAVLLPAAHPVYEHFRVRAFASLLEGPAGGRRRRLLGELMAQSHGSYGACGLGSNGTDRLVELVGESGRAQGLYGAKITGGGSGGTVAVLARRGAAAAEAVARIAEQYAAETGRATKLFWGSSPGAASFGVLRLAMD